MFRFGDALKQGQIFSIFDFALDNDQLKRLTRS
jgi:hypothetical protein